MALNVLITGGAGFVGSHLADELLRCGYRVRVLDNLSPQVHCNGRGRPGYLSGEVELQVGDVRDPSAVNRALAGIDLVFHLAASVGVGQSMYQIAGYSRVNCEGTAVLLEAASKCPLQRLVVASSMSIYGEGLYRSESGGPIAGRERSLARLENHDWEIRGENGEALQPMPTPETKSPALPSVYSITKYYQETLCLNVGRAYRIPTVALRFFNIFGTRQSLGNPYTGVLAIFAARYLQGKPPLINEDGRQMRDFVNVKDVARACRLAAEAGGVAGEVFNIGSGSRHSILQVAREMGRVMGKGGIEPVITGKYRIGDIRNCFADITKARARIGFEPRVALGEGLVELAQWLEEQGPLDGMADAQQELIQHGLSL